MHDQRLERLTFFSDAVFAIAMTLLVIELHVPELHGRITDAMIVRGLVAMMPNFVGFLISFLVIGNFWVLHHRGLALARDYDPRLAWANLWLLLTIVFLPFASALMSDFYGLRLPTLLYFVVLGLAGLAQRRMMRIALAARRQEREARALLRRLWAVPGVAALAFVAGLFAPAWSTLVLALIPVAIRLLERSSRASADEADLALA